MLRFFRNIRQKLLENGNIRKYFWYAIGEIFLVVIGILIALQVNNWNEMRAERNLEQRYLQRLVEDLGTDIENLHLSIRSTDSRKARAEFLLNVTQNHELIKENPTYFIKSVEYGGYTNNPVISDHTFEEIKSSGNLAIIQNEEIRTALSVYYSNRYNRDQFDFIRQDFQLQYLNRQKGILSPEQQIAMGSFSVSETYNEAEAKEVLHRMRDTPEFIDLLPLTIQSKIRTLETLETFLQQAQELQNIINSDLVNRWR